LVTVVDCPLPSKEEIEKEYVKLVVAYKKDLELPKTKQELKQLISIAAMSAVGLDKIQAINAFALSMAATKTIDISIIQKQKEQEVKKSDVLEFIETTEPIGNLGGFSKLKKWLKKREEAFSVEAMNYGLRYPKGILIVGPPGTGKSLCAKTVASFLKLPLLRLDIGKVYRSLLGESEQAIRTALRIAEAVSPSVLWIDEIEKGMAGAQNSDLDAGVSSRVVSTILTWRQETKYPVVLVATANDTKSIPSTIYRAGRIDKVWAVDLPQEEERKEILRIHLEKRKRNPVNFDINVLAKASEYFVGSELESCIEDAMFNAFSERREINTNDVVDAMKALIPQYVRDAEEIKEIREWVKTRADNVSDL
jgi:SpoVK/Ycf46/Vps4 family AAA+-type ATPase